MQLLEGSVVGRAQAGEDADRFTFRIQPDWANAHEINRATNDSLALVANKA
jgi:hypothetical protein